jgi:hypothetical protein
MDPQTPEQRRLVRRLYGRRDEGVLLRFEEVSVGDWRPEPHECYANTDYVARANPGWAAVRGWLYFEIGPDLCPRFWAHSAVEKPNGDLVEITAQASRPYPFIRHLGVAEDFDRLVAESSLMYLNYRDDLVPTAPPEHVDFGLGFQT